MVKNVELYLFGGVILGITLGYYQTKITTERILHKRLNNIEQEYRTKLFKIEIENDEYKKFITNQQLNLEYEKFSLNDKEYKQYQKFLSNDLSYEQLLNDEE